MKKLILLLIVFTVVATGFTYFVIPNNITLHQNINLLVNAKGFVRNISDGKKWNLWWPEKNGMITFNNLFSVYRFHGNTYTLVEKKLTSVVVSIKIKKDSIPTELFFIPLSKDSVSVNWVGVRVTSLNPVNRLQTYFKTKSINNDLLIILQSLQKFYSLEENLYGIQIKKELVLDSTLVSTSAVSKGYPTTENIYKLIDKLKAFAQNHGAHQTGLPMLNVNTSDSINYLTRVALPTDKKLKDEGDVVYRWMLGGGNILVTDVKGGPNKIVNAFVEMENYVHDFQRMAPAIPFQSLITDRRKEPDTSKWITKIYWPVM